MPLDFPNMKRGELHQFKEPKTAKFKHDGAIVEALQLNWGAWSAMCDFVDVGGLLQGLPEGCFLDNDGKPMKPGESSSHMGLLIPTNDGLLIVVQYEWVIKSESGELSSAGAVEFETDYEPIDD